MFNLVTVTGYSGGSNGPQNIYKLFESENTPYLSTRYVTVKDKIDENVEKVTQTVKIFFEKNRKGSILVGHSMGGAVIAKAAKLLEEEEAKMVAGIVLINPQSDGLHFLEKVPSPMLAINSTKDRWFPLWQLQSSYSRHKGPQRRLIIKELSHDLEKKGKNLAAKETLLLFSTILNEMNNLFIYKMINDEESPTTWIMPEATYSISPCAIL